MTTPPVLGPEPPTIINLRHALARFDDDVNSNTVAGVFDAAQALLAEWDRGRAAYELAMRETFRPRRQG